MSAVFASPAHSNSRFVDSGESKVDAKAEASSPKSDVKADSPKESTSESASGSEKDKSEAKSDGKDGKDGKDSKEDEKDKVPHFLVVNFQMPYYEPNNPIWGATKDVRALSCLLRALVAR